jgi:hypothetical protein
MGRPDARPARHERQGKDRPYGWRGIEMNRAPAHPWAMVTAGMFLLALASAWMFHGTTQNALVWDSVFYLSHHEREISSLGIENLSWMLTTREAANWHPLTWLSWAIDYQLYGGLDPGGFHLSNNVIHGLNSSLVFLLILVALGLGDPVTVAAPVRTDRDSMISAFLAALVFAAHPQHVESVAWVAERKDLLCQFFTLLALLAYARFATGPEKSRTAWYLGCLALFVLAAMSKPMAVTLPAILLLLDVYPLRRTALVKSAAPAVQTQKFLRLVLEKAPFFFVSACLAILTLAAQEGALATVPFDVRILNAFNSILVYISKFLLPLGFSPHYPYYAEPGNVHSVQAYIPVAGCLLITVVSVWAWAKGRPAWLTTWLFLLIGLSPVIGLIPVGTQGMADRYAYFPTLPFYILVGAGILAVLRKGAGTTRYAIVPVMLAVCILLAARTGAQIPVWKNELTLWSHAVATHPRNPVARTSLGTALMRAGDFERAVFHFEVIEYLPTNPTRMLALRAVAHLALGNHEKALADHSKLVESERFSPLTLDPECHRYNLGWIEAQLGGNEASAQHFLAVAPAGPYGGHARAWLDWLEKSEARGGDESQPPELPGFCKALIPEIWGSS